MPVALPSTFVALGDSFTEGMQDELGPDGRHIGWADRVAAAIATSTGGLRYANLAIRGRLLDQVVAEQLPVALELAPDLVSFHAGPNDLLLRPRGPAVADVLARYDAAVARLRSAGPDVVLFTVPRARRRHGPHGGRAGSPVPAVQRRRPRHGAAARGGAGRHRPRPALHDRRLWHEDRLHLSPEGHARVAAAVLEALGLARARAARRRAGLVARAAAARAAAAPVQPTSSPTSAGSAATSCPGSDAGCAGCPAATACCPKHTALIEVRPRNP